MPSIAGNRLTIVKGDGVYVTTDTGKKLLNATSALWHANVGHGRRELAQAAHVQIDHDR